MRFLLDIIGEGGTCGGGLTISGEHWEFLMLIVMMTARAVAKS